ncbi:rhamnulokinase family protein [Terrabacter sp. Ter38]|uniref:rhamnulokinase n=1 Tax=Terrabacter sp. Ter38 TaxID=2926030 RepID=UPI00211814F4|nr:rhamnulokinase family protein [Terrabacter sp. Ter38]
MSPRVFGAVDIGASGGRVMAGVVDGSLTTLHTLHRFRNGPVQRDGHLRWDLTRLWSEVLTGLRLLARDFPETESVGIDTWAVDYALLDAQGRLLAEPVSYRDGRTGPGVERVHARVGPEELYAVNGLQFLPFTTLYQLEVEKAGPLWGNVAHVVLLPDVLAYRLTGVLRTETTNASTTGLLDAGTGTWAKDLLDRLDLPAGLLPPLVAPGDVIGPLTSAALEQTGLRPGTLVTAVGSHDTASAVVAVPATTSRFAYVSSGTWSLAGLELGSPVITPASRAANFTNEGGVDGRTRFLRNVGGLWLLQESMRAWADRGVAQDLDALLVEAERLPPGGPLVDVDDDAFIRPDDMPERIAAAARSPLPDPAHTVRCILDSLAAAYASTTRRAAVLAGTGVDVIHVVGGGSRNHLLCQVTADLTGLPVVAGPVEATALGNVLVQARAFGAAPPTLEQIRADLAATQDLRRHVPS